MQQPQTSRIVPFIMMGIAIVAFIFGMMLLAYLLFFGALVGMALFTVTWIRDKFFPRKKVVKRSGRTIEHDSQ